MIPHVRPKKESPSILNGTWVPRSGQNRRGRYASPTMSDSRAASFEAAGLAVSFNSSCPLLATIGHVSPPSGRADRLLNLDVAGFVGVGSDCRRGLSLAKFPVPRLLVHGPNKTMRRRILFQPFIGRVAIPASDSYVEGNTVLMVGSARRCSEIVARQTSLIAVIQCLLFWI